MAATVLPSDTILNTSRPRNHRVTKNSPATKSVDANHSPAAVNSSVASTQSGHRRDNVIAADDDDDDDNDDDDDPLVPVVLARSLSAGSHDRSAFPSHLVDGVHDFLLPPKAKQTDQLPRPVVSSSTSVREAPSDSSSTRGLSSDPKNTFSVPSSQVEAFRRQQPHLNDGGHAARGSQSVRHENASLPEPKQKRAHKRHHPQHFTARELNFDPVFAPINLQAARQPDEESKSASPTTNTGNTYSNGVDANHQDRQVQSHDYSIYASPSNPTVEIGRDPLRGSAPGSPVAQNAANQAKFRATAAPDGQIPDHLPAPKAAPATPIVGAPATAQEHRPARAIVAARANSAGLGRKNSQTSNSRTEKPAAQELELSRRLSLDGNIPEGTVRPDADDQISGSDDLASSFNVDESSVHVSVKTRQSVLTDVSGCSKAGWEPSRTPALAGQPVEVRKENQDAYCVFAPFAKFADQIFLGVFDGHGAEGRAIAHYVRDEVPRAVQQVARSSSAISSRSGIAGINVPDVHKAVMHALKSAFSRAERGLTEADRQIDHIFSGTTAVVAWFFSNHVYTAWAGDSRAVVGRMVSAGSSAASMSSSSTNTDHRRQAYQQQLRAPSESSDVGGRSSSPQRYVAVELTYDQKPVRADEKKRVKAAGGRIARWRRNVGPLRVWLPRDWIPGLAMTRSIGDTVLTEYGVSPVPEVSYAKLTSADSFIVLASDGVWEFMSSQEVVDFVGRLRREGKTADGAAESLVREAVRRWRRNEIVVDDTTAVVMWMDCSVSSDGTGISAGRANLADIDSVPSAHSGSTGRKAFRLALGRGNSLSSSSAETAGAVSIIRDDGRLGSFVCKNDVQA